MDDFKDLLPYHIDLFTVMENHVELALRDVKNREYHLTLANAIGKRLYRAIIAEYDENVAKLFAEALRNYNEQIQRK